MAQDLRFPSFLSRRRFLQYAGTAALGGSFLSACAGTGGGSSSSSSNNSSLPTLNQWYHQYGEQGTHEAVLRYAKQYTKANVKVSWVPGTGNEYPDKVRAALLGSNAPDVFELPGPTVDQVKAGLIEPLDDIIADVKDDFNPVALRPLTINGKVYAIKMINDLTFVYYRKSLFDKAGLQPPKTVDDLINAAKKLTTKDMKGIYIGPDGGVNALSYIAGWAAGGDFLSDDNKITFNTDRVAAAYEKLKELNASKAVLPDAPTFWWDPSSFTQGTCAMQFCGLWAMPGIQKAIGDDFGIVAWPALDAKSQPATNYGGWAEMVWAKGKNVEAAKQYVKWLWIDNSDVQIDWNVGYGFHVPARKSIAAKTDKLKSGPAAQAVEILNNYGHATPPLWNASMDQTLTDAVSSILKSNADPLKTLNQAADKCNAELQKLLS
ncbi:sugar ABC transporter substrate-binding protein [Ktedonosporobacter rubrisoli]|uniref:Sugar ABC transporter substrate-binding protein n=1 Tax=Ktedonosporobacter rubrisoli TaxID=2509675 RepID=A0A4P6K3W3_KTERU|nr:sugar ABC transporter substrate-binding protein [Ktedonosporobacter rubrisoli]QBD82662.1 sugar ABC transporter substrate-binding protein [Ktedonosporobacter rubrisoli]